MYEISMVGRHKKWNSVTRFTGGGGVYVYARVRSIGLHIYPGYRGECAVNQVVEDSLQCRSYRVWNTPCDPGKVCKECGFRENDRVLGGD